MRRYTMKEINSAHHPEHSISSSQREAWQWQQSAEGSQFHINSPCIIQYLVTLPEIWITYTKIKSQYDLKWFKVTVHAQKNPHTWAAGWIVVLVVSTAALQLKGPGSEYLLHVVCIFSQCRLRFCAGTPTSSRTRRNKHVSSMGLS